MRLRIKRIFRKRQATYRRGSEPSSQQTYRWLLWLATKLKKDQLTEFSTDKIQPYWLDTKAQRLLYSIVVGLIIGVVIGLIYALSTGLLGATIGGLIYGIILASEKEIYLLRRLKLSIEFATLSLPRSIVEGLWWGVLYGLIDGVICYIIWGVPGFIIGMVQVIIWGFIEGVIWGSLVPIFQKQKKSNQGIQESVINAVFFTVIGGVSWLALYLVWMWAVRAPWEPEYILTDTIANGLFFTIYMGGFACLQHLVLRLILVTNGVMPWNYVKFLDYATDLGFLEREGGNYWFKYDLLESPDGENKETKIEE